MASDILKYWRFSRLRGSAHLVETPLPLFGGRYDPAALGRAMNLRGDAENGPAARSLVKLNGSFALLDAATDGVQRDTARLPLEEELVSAAPVTPRL
jgi:hypothetical protein